jgi:hypothetical protein
MSPIAGSLNLLGGSELVAGVVHLLAEPDTHAVATNGDGEVVLGFPSCETILAPCGLRLLQGVSADPLDDNALAALVEDVRASVVRATSAALDEMATTLPEPIVSMSLRAWPTTSPKDIAVQRRALYESRADSVMYCQVLAELARQRGWEVHLYNSKDVEDEAVRILGERADEVLHGPRAMLGPPWSKDHRMALAATIVVA